MVDPATTRRWIYRGVYLLICLGLIFVSLLPLSTEPGRVPGPDLIFALTAAVIMRRPRYAPLASVVFVLVLTDILFLRPIGLWAAIALLGTEVIRGRASSSTETPWPAEVTLFAIVFASATLINTIMFALFGLPLPGLGAIVVHVILTCVAYPVVILITHYLLRIRRARPSDIDAVGGTL